MTGFFRFSCVTAVVAVVMVHPLKAVAAAVTAEEVLQHCYYKPKGQDQKTKLEISITRADGQVNRNRYVRLWKAYEGRDGLVEKMALFTLEPKESKGVNFMRWAYTRESGKQPEQWVYLPELRKIRRVSARDPADLSWGLIDEDFRERDLDEDDHKLIGQEQVDGETLYTIESRPKHEDSQYRYWVSRFARKGDWSSCAHKDTVYYDKAGKRLKTVSYTWNVVDGAWVWDTVTIENRDSTGVVKYRIYDIAVNVGLSDRDFSERVLQRGMR